MSDTHDMLQLLCAFAYSYGSIDWYADGALIGSNGGYDIMTSTFNTTAMVRESMLTILDSAASGEYRCSLATHVLMLDGQESINTGYNLEGREEREREGLRFDAYMSVSVDYYFIVQPVGTQHMVPCHFQETIVTATEVLRNGELFIPKENSNMVTIKFQPIQDSDQGQLYSCVGEGASGLVYLNFTVITTGKGAFIMLTLSSYCSQYNSSFYLID